jgi:O-antigen/teichoic acid export membrane protein
MTSTAPPAPAAFVLLRSVSAYSVAIFAPRVLRLVTVPLIVRAVSIQTYGVFALLSLVAVFTQIACDFGLGTAGLRLAPETDGDGKGSLFATLIVTRAAAGLAALLSLWWLGPAISRLLTGSPAYAWAVPVLAGAAACSAVSNACCDQLRSQERHSVVARCNMFQSILESATTVALVVVLRWGITGLVLGRLAGEVAVILPLSWVCRRTLRHRFDVRILGKLVRLGAPFVALYLLTALRELDRYLVKLRLGVDEVGQYDLALRIVGPVALSNLALAMVFEPYAYRTFRVPGAQEMMGLFFRAYSAAFSTLAFTVAVFAPEIIPVLAPDTYGAAAGVAPALLFAFVTEGIRRASGLGADFAKRTEIWALAAMTESALALSIAYYALPKLRILGAGLGFLLGAVGSSVLTYSLARRLFPLSLPLGRALFLVILGATASTWAIGGIAGAPWPLPLRILAIPAFALVAWRVSGLETGSLRHAFRVPIVPGH